MHNTLVHIGFNILFIFFLVYMYVYGTRFLSSDFEYLSLFLHLIILTSSNAHLNLIFENTHNSITLLMGVWGKLICIFRWFKSIHKY